MVAVTFTLPAEIELEFVVTEVVVAAFCTVKLMVADLLEL